MENIIKFQTDRDLDKKAYDALNEHTNIFAELLESIGLDVPKENRTKLKIALADFVKQLSKKDIAHTVFSGFNKTPKDEQADAYCDVITFSVGALLKLGYDPIKAIEQCGLEINSRRGSMVDGKFEKDLSDEAKALWIKADYTVARLN